MSHFKTILIAILFFSNAISAQNQIDKGVVKYKFVPKVMNIGNYMHRGNSEEEIEAYKKDYKIKFTQEFMLKFDKNQALFQLSAEDIIINPKRDLEIKIPRIKRTITQEEHIKIRNEKIKKKYGIKMN